MDEQDRTRVAALFKGVAHPTRIAILNGIRDEISLVDVAEQADVSRGTVQDHVEMLRENHLVYRPDDGGRQYRLTPIGDWFLFILANHGDRLAEAVATVEAEEEAVEERYDDISELPLDERDVDLAVNTEVWTEIGDEVGDILKYR